MLQKLLRSACALSWGKPISTVMLFGSGRCTCAAKSRSSTRAAEPRTCWICPCVQSLLPIRRTRAGSPGFDLLEFPLREFHGNEAMRAVRQIEHNLALGYGRAGTRGHRPDDVIRGQSQLEVAYPLEPFGLFFHFRGNLQRLRTLVQYFGFKLLPEQKQAITLLLGIWRIVGSVSKNHAALRRRQFCFEPL